jgi:hypothetical protein
MEKLKLNKDNYILLYRKKNPRKTIVECIMRMIKLKLSFLAGLFKKVSFANTSKTG